MLLRVKSYDNRSLQTSNINTFKDDIEWLKIIQKLKNIKKKTVKNY